MSPVEQIHPGSRNRRSDRGPAPFSALLIVFLLATAVPAMAQEGEPGWLQRALSATNESTSVGMVPQDQRHAGWKGWFEDAWDGSKRIFRDGQTDLLLPVFAWHPAYKHPNRFDQNSYPWGVGVARTVIDEKDNERIVYALGFSDSHYDLQPMVGYGWIARWPLVAGLKGGLGYTVFVTARSDTNYIPFPAVLPVASIGTDRFMLYGSWIPSTDVVFFFTRISLPYGDGGPAPASGAPAAAGEPGRWRANLIYGAGAWVDTNASGINTVASGNSSAPLLGYRRYFGESWAVDLSASKSNLSLDLNGARLGTFDMTPVILAAQYHLPSYRGLHMFAGLGVSYNRFTNQQMPGYSLSGTSVAPVLQAGVDYRVTDALVITGGLSANFTRNQLKQGDTNQGTVQLSPTTFSLGIGFAF